jgi:hypothetical protein
MLSWKLQASKGVLDEVWHSFLLYDSVARLDGRAVTESARMLRAANFFQEAIARTEDERKGVTDPHADSKRMAIREGVEDEIVKQAPTARTY